jgi:branched-chain amino acid transport system ATP-binding protein
MSELIAPKDAASGSVQSALALDVRDVRCSFGGVTAVDVERVEVPRNSILALIGPNGAGKTTLFNVLTGFQRSDSGSWLFNGEDVSGRPAHIQARLGMVRTFQTARVFPRLTALENLLLAAPSQRGERIRWALFHSAWRKQEAERTVTARELLEWVGLGAKADDPAGSLSGGQRKLLELARAVMAEPTLLMLDEPMAGVNPALRQALLENIMSLPGRGITVMFVEHDMDVVSAISDHIVCMAEGRVISVGTAAQVAADPAVVEAYLGKSSVDLRHIERVATTQPDDDAADAADAGGTRG